jgi:hypothetical protein
LLLPESAVLDEPEEDELDEPSLDDELDSLLALPFSLLAGVVLLLEPLRLSVR